MIIISWNINGLRSYQKKADLQSFLTEHNADILNLQETKLVQDWSIEKNTQLNNEWKVYQNLASCRKGYSGVATISRKDLTQIEMEVPNNRFITEGRLLGFQYKDLHLINVYMPQGGRTKEDVPYKLEICKYLQDMIRKNFKKCVLAGDFNMACCELDLARPKQNTNNNMFTIEERSMMQRFEETGLIDLFRYMYPEQKKYTWWPYAYNARERDIGWRLDYIYTSRIIVPFIKRVEILSRAGGSDHCPVLIEIEEDAYENFSSN